MKFPYLREGQIQAAAARLKVDAFGSEAAVRYPLDLEELVFDHLCERHQLVFDDSLDLGRAGGEVVLGKMRPFDNSIMITAPLKRDGPPGRYRFTVAHEIGHWVLHRPLFLAVRDQGDLFTAATAAGGELVSLNRNVFPDETGRGFSPPEEWQANQFAIALLLDDPTLQRAFAERFGRSPVRPDSRAAPGALRRLARQLASDDDGTGSLQELFGLSMEAMAIALEARGYVSDAPELGVDG